MVYIDKFSFDISSLDEIKSLEHYKTKVGENWPIVYVLNNEKEAYVGETVNAARRAEQHLGNEEKQKLTEIRIISDKDFNKSVILDLESFLIKHMSADGKYRLINGNNGIQDHDYYERSYYEEEFTEIWNRLKKLGVVDNTIDEIENSELFKYSPYKSLGDEQFEAELQIIKALEEYGFEEKGVTVIVRGGAGTGKTILAVYLMKLFADINNKALDRDDPDDYIDEDMEFVYASERLNGIKKIGIVFPQKSLRTSLKDVFGSIRGLDPSMVLSASDVVSDYVKTGKKFDLLIVDEAHRLKRRDKGNLFDHKLIKKCNEQLGLDEKKGTELDWICMCSRNHILFRDELQTIRACDIDDEYFREIINKNTPAAVVEQALNTQWRCLGGNGYIEYIKAVLSCRPVDAKAIDNYDLKLYDDVQEMVEDIKALDREIGLCRVAAGYAWEWKTKKDKNAYDIEIEDYKYRWNSTYDNWINTDNAVNEIGCIHTVQGYDLNYLGVIIGSDIKYDREKKVIYADKTNYYDSLGKAGLSHDPEALREYLVNIYLTLLTRGIEGTYIYACDEALREYLSKYIPKA